MSVINLIFGPQHPALHEPELFRFKVEGEIVVKAEPRIGYVHRGIEKLFERNSYIRGIYLSERICGICNAAHTVCYCQVVENALGIEPPPRARYLRTIVHELNRIHSHLLLLGVAAEELGFDTLFMLIWRDRELVMDLIELVTGNRVMTAFNTIGGVRRDITPEVAEKCIKALSKLEERVKYYRKVFEEDPTIRRRTVEVGVLPRKEAIKYCVVGPMARGSAVDVDIRRDWPYAAYDEIPFNVIVRDECDVWARLMVRVDETIEAINIVRYALEHLPKGEIRLPLRRAVPPAEAVSRVEAPRGELIYHLISKGGTIPYRLKVRTPTLANLLAAAKLFEGNTIADIPAILVSIDPCFACTDRVTLIDLKDNKVKRVSLRELARRCRK
ncbi:MAG: NADH-quinone oxidoreductase subunit D [Thermoprotei archaeon]|nr:MAG: NADH-quinone oxidoreductase subunit D [Thermoprotei archaeon]RLF21050.1 MAG: NADH-quinone oxidoreductase subunit D [Thermoprotei archaeon]